MRPRTLMLDGVTRRERHQVTMEIHDAISAAGGWIMDENFFSNIAVAIRFFTPHKGFEILQTALGAADVRLDEASAARLAEAIAGKPPQEDEIPAALNITFSHNEPDMRREVPAVPG